LRLAQRAELPIALAAIPARLEPSLAARVRNERRVRLLVHGLSHANHAPEGRKKAEFGADRALAALKADAELALATAAVALGSRLLPVFVPPWNRIAPSLAAILPGLGFRGLSTFGSRPLGEIIAGLVQINPQLDPVDWPGGRGLIDPETLIAQLAALVQARGNGRKQSEEPIGLLTHHLVHDEAAWGFCAELLDRLSLHENVRYPSVSELFVMAEPSMGLRSRDRPEAAARL
jgi:hypothetical protein